MTTDSVVNHSAGNSSAPITVDVWLRPDADVEAARKALEHGEVTSAHLMELTPEGARLQVKAAIDAGARPRGARNGAARAGARRPA